MKIYIYYRHSTENNNNPSRPYWFSYEKCFKNLYRTISKYDDVELTLSLDGNIDNTFMKYYTDKFTLFQVNRSSSLLSYRDLLSYIKKQTMDDNDLIYFLENDYLHVDGWIDNVKNLYNTYQGLHYVSLYDHNDKYFYEMYDDLVSKIIVTSDHHWRTTPSTCGSYIVNRKVFDEDYDIWSTTVGDHNTFLHLNESRGRFVFTPIPGLSTHCMEGLMSPCIDWEKINSE